MIVITTFILLLVAVLLYVLYGRPFLERRGTVKPLPVTAATWRDRVALAVHNKATVAWGYLTAFFGFVWGLLQQAAGFLSDPEIKYQITNFFSQEWFWLVMVVFGVVTVVARLTPNDRDPFGERNEEGGH